MTALVGWSLVAASGAVAVVAYAGYPAWLWLTTRARRTPGGTPPASWPTIAIAVPVYNEAHAIADTLDRLLAADYPADRRQIVVVSDASTDGTDEIVRGYAARGVELVRLPQRGGKTAAENAARPHLHGEFVIQTDASVRIDRNALKPLIASFQDPQVGVASGRDVSVARDGGGATAGESGYVGYEMWVRDLETTAGGIVGASGCLYATRKALHMEGVPPSLSRDFAAPLIAIEQGYRSVSVPAAVCYVPRTASLRREYRRKVRTMTRGLGTLFYKRHLLNPVRYGGFAFRLGMHKLVRWLVPWAAVTGLIGLVWAAWCGSRLASVTLALGVAATIVAVAAWFWPDERPLPRLIGLPAFAFWGIVAGLHAWINVLRGELHPTWEPTRRS